MKTRAEIKTQAKAALSANYGLALGSMLLCALIIGAASSFVPFASLFLLPLEVGLALTFLMMYRSEVPTIGTMFTSAFQENYGRKLGGMLLVALYTFLWSLLFVIPGIIKGYAYAMTPYILAKYPNVSADNAITLSRRIMNGRKADLFVVELSFIGWHLLSVFTFGLLSIFYVAPYQSLTMAGCFDEYLADALATGRITEEDLGLPPKATFEATADEPTAAPEVIAAPEAATEEACDEACEVEATEEAAETEATEETPAE